VWIEPVTLRGARIVLEPLAERHRDGLTAAAADPAIWRLMSVHGHLPEIFAAWVDEALRQAADGTGMPFVTLDASTGEPLGSTRYFMLEPAHRRLEIGHTWLVPRAWSTGANAEAKLLLLGHAFERLGCRRVEFKTDARNERSRAALAALPAEFEGIHRSHMLVRDGESRDSAWYSVIDEEWPQVREALLRRLTRPG
jgi:N-acetyltransferase